MTRGAVAAGLALPLAAVAAHAQPAARMRRIGILLHDGAPPGLLEAFRAGLHDLGHVDGRNVVVETRDAAGDGDRLAALAAELVRLEVDLILAPNTPAALAAKKATSTIPIVITRVTDPAGSGLVASLGRPGGNVTGLSFDNAELALKGLQLLREPIPGIARVAVLSNAGNPAHAPQVKSMEATGSRLGLEIVALRAKPPAELPAALQAATRARAQALFVLDFVLNLETAKSLGLAIPPSVLLRANHVIE